LKFHRGICGPEWFIREPEGRVLYGDHPDFGSFQGSKPIGRRRLPEADQLSFSPDAVASAGHGAWKHGVEIFSDLRVNLTFDKFSTECRMELRVRQTATIDKTGNSYTGSGDFNYFDTGGSSVFGGTFTVTATRDPGRRTVTPAKGTGVAIRPRPWGFVCHRAGAECCSTAD
jgi:hypothetical protein